MENIVRMVAEKAGIPEDKAKTAVDTVVGFLKDKMPGGIGGQVDSFLKGGSDQAGGAADAIKSKLGGMF